jgi:diguanylate cyclase (GGDEF)-like protein
VSLRPIEPTKKWLIAISLLVCLQLLGSLLLTRGFELTALGDLTQCALLLLCTVIILSNASKAESKPRLFWALMTLAFGMWLWAQGLWTYFEIVLRQDVPNPFVGDVILFLHIVPMMGALAVQPHMKQGNQSAHFGSLDFLLLLIWWLYLFLFLVIPWQYVSPSEAAYGHNFNLLYLAEHLVFLFALALVWRRSSDSWRTIYAQCFGAALLYAVSSLTASAAIDRHLYYTGSLYDLPLVVAMACFTYFGLTGQRLLQQSLITKTATAAHGIWAARLAMLAVFSTPLMIAWVVFDGHTPQRVRTYRLLLTVGAMLVMGFLVFLKQHWLDRELIHLLATSHQNLQEMVRLKDDLVNKEQSLRWHSMELQRKNLELQQVSFTDPLTGVWNRRYLEETLAADATLVLRSYQRNQGSDPKDADRRDLVFIMVDVDFFKRINDDYGHAAGDELLRKIAQRLSTVMRKSDLLVRWGGEEFLIMSRSADRAGTPVFCSRILDVMASEPFVLLGGVKVRKTCSIGWSPYPWCTSAYEAICAEEVIELADTALYVAKSLGRNQSVGFLPSDQAVNSPERINIETLRHPRSSLIKVINTPATIKVTIADGISEQNTAYVPESDTPDSEVLEHGKIKTKTRD